MSMSNTSEAEWLEHILNNVPIPNIGDATGLPASATNGSCYAALHTADPGETGTQATSEATYTGYARVAVARNPSSKKWTVGGTTTASNAEEILFGECTAGSSTVTHLTVGKASSGATVYLFRFLLNSGTPLAISTSSNQIPKVAVGGAVLTAD